MRSTFTRPLPLAWVLGLAVGFLLPSTALAVESVLAPHRTERALSDFIFTPPARCIDLTAESRACLWQIGNRYASWKPLARSIGTRARVNIICTLPPGDAERDDGSCNGYPQRSNRDHFEVVSRTIGKGKKRNAHKNTAQARKEKAEIARAQLGEARDLAALIALTGTLPTVCVGKVGGDRTCQWELNNGTLGHGTVAAAGGFPLGDRVRLECPIDAGNALRGACLPRAW